MKTLADTNVVLRFLLRDHPALSPRAATLFARAAEGSLQLLVPTFILAECVFTLQSFYKVGREELATGLETLLALPGVRLLEGDHALHALRLYRTHHVDFADALLAAMSADLTLPVATFDRDFRKLGAKLLDVKE